MHLRPPAPSARRLAAHGLAALVVGAAAYAAAGAVLWARGDEPDAVAAGPETGPGGGGHPGRAESAGAGEGWRRLFGVQPAHLPTRPLFPVQGEFRLTDSFGDPRAGGRRRHAGVDIMAVKGTPVVAVADGVVDWMADEVGGDCCAVGLAHDGGWRTKYIHLDNDTAGTDDGRAYGIAPGVALGVHLRAGDLVGWVGDSGNAETTAPHLHFELIAPNGHPYDPHAALDTVAAAPVAVLASAPASGEPSGHGSRRGGRFAVR